MANQKISALTTLNEADVVAADVLAIADISGTETKKISSAELVKAGARLNTGSVPFGGPLGLQAGTAGVPSLYISGDPNTGIYSPGADQLGISTGGTERLLVDASGRVGIGTSTPAAALHAASATGLGLQSYTTLGGGSPAASGTTDPNVLARFQGGSVVFDIGGTTGGSQWIQPRLVSDFSANFDLSICPNGGNVGIGAISPGYKLDIAPGAAGAALRLRGGSGGSAILQFTDSSVATQWGTVEATSGSIDLTHSSSVRFFTASSERARVDSLGRLLIGTGTARSNFFNAANTAQLQVEGNGEASVVRNAADAFGPSLVLGKSRSSANTLVSLDDALGTLSFQGNDGTEFVQAANINVIADGTPAADSMPGRLVFSTTSAGSATPVEELRITNDGVVCYNQVTPTTKSAAATLTVAELKTKIIQYTGAAATLTLPTGTLTEAGFAGIYTNMTFEWCVINTGSGACTIGAATGHTIVGSATVATATSARYASRRTAANTFVSYRVA